jgi:tRNA(Ile)-lysidine synthase
MPARADIPADTLDALGGPGAPPVVAAVSGGADSVAMALMLDDARRAGRAPRLILAHLNHRIRGANADRDAEFVRELAARLGLPAVVETCDVPAEAARRRLSLEHAARECRYEFLQRAAREAGARWVAVGHNADDRLETVLFNLMRGAGIHGLAGMPRTRPVSPHSEARIIRPLLDVPHHDLVEFLSARGQPFRTDATNLDTAYTRNRIRHALIPALSADWPTLREDVAEFADEMGELDRLLEQCASEWIAAHGGAAPIDGLAALDEPILSYVVRALIARTLGDLRRIDEVHVRMVIELLAAGSTGASLDLPRGLVVRRDYGAIRFEMRSNAPEVSVPERGTPQTPLSFADATLDVPGSIAWGGWTLRAEWLQGESLRAEMPELPANPREAMRALIQALRDTAPERVQYMDADRVGHGPLTVRARRPGDRFMPLGAPGHTKLKDYLIGHKVPHGERDRLPLVESGGRIVAVVTVAVSGDAALTEGTARVLKIAAQAREA